MTVTCYLACIPLSPICHTHYLLMASFGIMIIVGLLIRGGLYVIASFLPMGSIYYNELTLI